MSSLRTSSEPKQSQTKSKSFVDNRNKNDSDEHATFLQHLHLKSRPIDYQQQYKLKKSHAFTKPGSSTPSQYGNRTQPNLLEIKQQRLLAAADRKKRIIARIISFVGLLIIILCAVIVTLTLKMAPKIDELVRSKTGKHNLVFQISRFQIPVTTPTMDLNNSTINNSSIWKSTISQ